MKNLRSPLDLLGASILASFCVIATAQAIDVGQYVISAKAGGVNLASGGVTVQRKGKAEWQPIAAKDRLDAGDLVRTNADGRLEILLNPGSYMRADGNSEFELADPSLNNLRIKLVRGSAIIEATGFGGAGFLTEIDTPQTRVAIIENGLYRIDLQPNTTSLFVRKGRALVGGDVPIKVKRGRKIVVSSPENTEVAKFDKKAEDAFDQWSGQRAETLIAANRNLSMSNLGYSIASSMNRGWGYYPWGSRYLGVWVYDPILSFNTFYPFYNGTYSPYGYGYSRGFGLPSDCYRPPSSRGGQQPPSIAPNPPNGGKRPGPNGTGGDLVVRPVPADRHELRVMREQAFRDSYRGREMGTFDRGGMSSSQGVHSGPTYGSGPASSPSPAARGPSGSRGERGPGMGRAAQ